MANKELTIKLCELIAPVVATLGYELWGCELQGLGKHTLLRVYLDAAQGITVADCEKVSKQISAILDVEDLIMGPYDLEVSSPGLDRALFKREHYQRFIGSKVHIKLHMPLHGQRNYGGIISAVSDNEVTITADNKEIVLAIADIEKANIVPEF